MTNDPTRDELLNWDRRHYWHAFTQMADYEPLVIARAEGCRLFDVDGRSYLDGASSMWCNVHGHRHPRIDAAIREQLDLVAHCTSLGMGCDTTVRLAKRLADLAPNELNRVFFASDGSSAVEVALKMAFQYWRQCESPQPKKTKFMALGEAYHGDTIGSASVGGIVRFHGLFEPLLFDVIRVPLPDLGSRLGGMLSGRSPVSMSHVGDNMPTPLCGEDMAPDVGDFLRQMESTLAAHHEEVAAMVIEPLVQCAAGMVMHPPGYLRGVRELTQKFGVLLIADEVAVGMGRTGTMFACQQEGVVPDMLCLGKGLTGGYLPMSATLTTDKIFNAFLGGPHEGRTLHHGHTYSGNPLAAAAALATLDVFEEEQTLAKLPAKIERLGEHLTRLFEHPHVSRTRQCGFIGALELTPDKASGLPYAVSERRAWRVCREALSRGVWIRPLGDVLYVMPPLAISLGELDELMEVLSVTINEVTRQV
ncbi:MAG: adenosylmethionine--8-amino-7-oxononanoate transaminase [Pirellulales bacterium]